MIKINNKTLFQKLGNESVILHLTTEEYFGLDEVGTRIWEVLSQEGDIEKALPVLLEEFDVTKDVLRKDMEELVAKLKAEKILVDA